MELNRNSDAEEFSEWIEKCFHSRLDQAEEGISENEDRSFEIIQSEENTGKKNKESLHDLYDTVERTNLWIIAFPEREESKKGTGSLMK